MQGLSVLQNSHNWTISEEPFKSGEEELFESLIEDNPEVLPVSEINPLINTVVPIGRQVTAGNNSIDLLYLADTGHLVVAECKLIQNPEARREVLPQLIEYCLSIRSGWDSKHVLSIASEYFATRPKIEPNNLPTVADRINSILQKDKAEQPILAEATLKKRIDRHIKNPILIIAGNRIDQRALVLADFLRTLRVPMACVEVRRYRVGTALFAIGQVKAASLLIATSSGGRETITEEAWLSLDDSESFQMMRKDFLDWSKTLADKGLVDNRIGSVQLMIDIIKGDTRKNVLSIDNRLWIAFSGFRDLGCPEELISEYRQKIESIAGRGVLGSGTSWPSISFVHLTDDEKRNALKAVLKDLIVKAKGELS